MALPVTILAKASPLQSAIDSLEEISKISPEIVQRFFDGLDSFSELVRMESNCSSACESGEYHAVFHPSDRFVEFLATVEAGSRNDC